MDLRLTCPSSLSAINSGAPSDMTVALDTTYSAGATVTKVQGAPPLPTTAANPANYPTLDKTPPTDSAEVKAWISAIDWSKVPNYSQTDGTCAGSPSAINDGRCWWTCGGCSELFSTYSLDLVPYGTDTEQPEQPTSRPAPTSTRGVCRMTTDRRRTRPSCSTT